MTSHEERTNYIKLSQGIEICTSIAQDILAKFIPSSDLSNKVRSYSFWNRLNREQKLLVSKSTSDGYKDFDITLIYTILRNVCVNLGDPNKPNLPAPTGKWGNNPFPNNVTPSDDVERIRILKDYYSHLSRAALPDQDFEIKWKEIQDICIRMKTYLDKDYLVTLQRLEDYPEDKIEKLHEELLKYNLSAIQNIQVSPLENFGKKLHIDQLYSPVVIREDLEQKHQGHRPDEEKRTKQERKLVQTPDDMFYKDGELSTNVFMQGEAGHGKTTFCLQLLRYWCSAKQSSKEKLSIWEKGLDVFKFVFLVTLRHVDKNRSSLIDMICYDTLGHDTDCSETTRHVLCSEKYQCLIIVDGLDEWKASPEAKVKLTHEGIPNTKELRKCSVFLTSRPWKFGVVAILIKDHDRVVEIAGLHEEGIKTVIRNVLVNYIGLDEGSNELNRCYDEIVEKTKGENLKSLMNIPLLLIISVILLYRKERVAESKTTFYMAMLTLLIEQTFEYKALDHSITQKFSACQHTDFTIPFLIQNEDTLKNLFDVLIKLGEVAYQDLISDETNLVFGKTQLVNKIGEAELEFALRVGLLSQCDAPSSYKKQVSVSFIDKTVQEFHAAIYISSTGEIGESFRKYLSSINKVMEFSNVIIFTTGLSPYLGSVLSQHILKVADKDKSIRSYRDTFDGENEVRLLYGLLVSWYREMKQGLRLSNTTSLPFYVSDINLHYYINGDSVRTSVEMMCNNPTHIVSLSLECIPDDDKCGITDRELTQILDKSESLKYLYIYERYIFTISNRFTTLTTLQLRDVIVTPDAVCRLQSCIQHNTVLKSLTLYDIKLLDKGRERKASLLPTASLGDAILCLPKCHFLSTLHIRGLHNTNDVQILVDVLPKLKCLRNLLYRGNYFSAAVAHTASCMKQLQCLQLEYIYLGDRSLELTSEMSQIETVVLFMINMTSGGWDKFVNSLINIQHNFDILLSFTDLDKTTCAMIRSIPSFKVKMYEGCHMLQFSRVVTSTEH